MGGKAKQSQRTKNNARPSSSGRSAELLNSVDNSWNPTGVGKMPTLFPTLTTPIIDQGLTAEFAVCIRKLNKKDPVTKTKALQELSELVNNSKVDDVAATLPSWAHFYKILAVDTDCKVREAAQSCHACIARACGRRLAPLLRQLVPAWLQAQYDEHAPAQTHAANSLKATFPENKLPEVISFCKAEVLAHFLDNIIGTGDKSILNRIDSPEERALQQTRLTCSSLAGLRFLTRHMPEPHRDWLWAALQPLLASNGFWTLAQHKEPHVRGAWYGLVGSAVETFGARFGDAHGARCARILLASSHAQHAAVADQLWACLLAFMFSVEDWHKWLDKKDLLTKRILDMLEQGGWGDARKLSDMLLPLLAHLPKDMLDKNFYESFFNAFYNGLDKKNILSSKSERQHWITSLSECLRYLSIQPYNYVVEVATSVHRTWLKKVLHIQHDTQLRKNLIKHSASSMASLVKYWLKQSKEPNGEKYDQLVRNFWQNIASTVLAQIENPLEPDKIALIIDGHILLLQTLKTSLLPVGKKTQSIKFDGDTPTDAEVKSEPVQEIDPVLIERYKHNLNEAVEKVCCGYFELVDKLDATETVLTPLITILNDFDSKGLYVAVAKHFNGSGAYELYERVLRRWMVTDTMRSKAVVDVIFIVMKHLTEEEQDAVLASFDQFPCGAMEWCVSCALGHSRRLSAPTRRWLRAPAVRSLLVTLTRRLLTQQCPLARNLLFVSLCLDTGEGSRNDMIISPETASAIAEVVSEALKQSLSASSVDESSAVQLQHAGAVGAHLATALADRAAGPHYRTLVLNLFRVTLYVPRGDPRLSNESWTEVMSGVHDGLQALSRADRSEARAQAAAEIHLRLYSLVDAISIPTLEHMTSLCPQLLSEVDDPAPPADVSELVDFTKQLFNFKSAPNDAKIETSALRYDCIVGKLNCPFEDGNEHIKAVAETSNDVPNDITKEDFVPYANRFLFRAIYLRTLLMHKGCDDEDEEEDQKENPAWCNHLLGDEYLLGEFCSLLREYMVLNSLHDAYGFWPHHDLIHQTKSKLDSIVDEIISETSKEVRSIILERLTTRAAAEGYYWAVALGYFEKVVDMWTPPKVPSLADNFDIADLNDIITGNGYIHSLQASHKGLEESDRPLQTTFAVMARSMITVYWPLVKDPQFLREVVLSAANCDIDYLIQFYQTHQHLTLHQKTVCELSWPCIVAEASVVSCVLAVLQRDGWDKPDRYWDFANVQLCTLVQSLAKSLDNFGCAKVALIARVTFELYCFVERFIGQIKSESERRQPPEHIYNLIGEWRDVFAPVLNRDALTMLLYLLDESSPPMISSSMVQVIAAVGAGIPQVQWELLDPPLKEELSLERLVTACAGSLARVAHPALHCLAYRALRALTTPLAHHTDTALAAWSLGGSEGGEDRARPPLASEWLHPHFQKALELAACALAPHTLGEDSCEMEPGSDAHAVVLGCLLLAECLHDLTTRARGDLCHHYIQEYRENQYAEQLLPIALKLIPAELLRAAQQAGSAPLPQHFAQAFQQPHDSTPDDSAWWSSVGLVACRTIFTTVGGAGAGGARGWWGAAGRGLARALSRLVAAFLTPGLVRRQLDQLHARKDELEDTEVTVHWSSNEAVMVYRIEDRPVELWVRFEADFPLSLPRVSAPVVRPAVTTSWIPIYITYQNGTVLNACKLWTEALSSKVESSPPCFVCYCRLHPATGHLPQVRCHQCRNRFHTACLHKWFVSSHKSNCPLCRSNF